jgi:uroporphyrinogen-III synthase
MRVLLVRPLADAERSAEALRRAGHEPVVAPVLRVVSTGAPALAGPFDAILLTSANAVSALLTLPGGERPPVFAVGARTAAAAEAAGLTVRATASGSAADLAALIRASLPLGAALLHVAGRDRKAEPERSLGAAGYRVGTWESYAAEPVPALPDPARAELDAGRLDAILHYSERSAATLLALAEAAGLGPALHRVAHLCLSPAIADLLRAAGLPRVASAAHPRQDALLERLAELARTG